ncbi:MAG: ABC transporter permease subunit [Verrucomicrobiota bacterium]
MRRRYVIFSAVIVFVLGWIALPVGWSDLVPSSGGRQLAFDFFSSAFQPAFEFEINALERAQSMPFWAVVLNAWWMTLRYAIVSTSLAVLIGFIGGILASRSWWVRPSPSLKAFRFAVRSFAIAVRSVHELFWALFFLAAFGTSPLVAVLALAIPFSGALIKIFSELIDEADTSARDVFLASGASGLVAMLFGILSRELPNGISYVFYRFECAIRSSVVLGFIGIPTIGYRISTAFEDGHYREIWTYFYVLIASIGFVEFFGSRMRMWLSQAAKVKHESNRNDSLTLLWRKRSRSMRLRLFVCSGCVLVVLAWVSPGLWFGQSSFQDGFSRTVEFFEELVPYPVREYGSFGEFLPWIGNQIFAEGGGLAIWWTFHLATLGALLAGAAGVMLSLMGARRIATDTPFSIPVAKGAGVRRTVGMGVRFVAAVSRALPEFILAFLLLQIFGPTLWALILALAVHNAGILARLNAEVIDNTVSTAPQVLLLAGGKRSSAFFGTLITENFNRLLLLLCYRWETCIRDATVLGTLGVGTIGFLISEARLRLYYDEMLLLTILSGVLVFAGDLGSDWLRRKLALS